MNKIYFYYIIIILIVVVAYNINHKFTNINNFINQNGNITTIILNYNRPHNIQKLVNKLKNINYIDEIIISHGKEDTEIIIKDDIVINETTLRNKYYSATRFELASKAKNNIILFLDDDLSPSNRLIENILYQMNKDGFEWNQNLYGPFNRICNNKYSSFTFFSYNTILTKLAIISKDRAIKVWDKIKNGPDFETLMENKGNGEDLLFSKYVDMFNGNNVYINGPVFDLDGSKGYSSNSNHYKVRTNLCKTINNYDYGQIIEKNIMMCSYHNKIEDMDIKLQKNIQKLKDMNLEYTFYYYNDDDIIEFIKQNYDNNTLYLYQNINDCYGAAKADFFRYLWIYRMGGIYLDLKSSARKPFNQIIKPFDEIILSSWKTKSFHDKYKIKYGDGYIDNNMFGEFTQWNIICRKNHPLIKEVIDSVKNKLNRPDYKHGARMVINTTGPVIYTNTIMKLLDKYNYTFKYNSINNNLIYTIYLLKNTHRFKKISKNNYRTSKLPIMKYTESKTIKQLIDKVYVINLRDNKDRLDLFNKYAIKNNIEYERFEAINGKELESNHPDILKYFTIDNNLSKGAIGCALSHIKIWEDAYKNNYENIMIFEDDAIIFDNFWDNLQNTYNYLPDKWDILYLDIMIGYLRKIDKYYISRLVYKEHKNVGMVGYIINKNMINKIISQFNNNYKLNMPIDMYIRNLNNNSFYITEPNLITFPNNLSTINGNKRDYFYFYKMLHKTYIK